MKSVLLPLLPLLLAHPAALGRPGETLIHVALRDADAPALGEALAGLGFDVVEGSVGPGELELVVTAAELAALERDGRDVEVLAHGRPFREIQAERLAEAAAEGVPPTGYKDLSEIVDAMDAFANAHPAICQLVDLTAKYGLPTTEEGRSLYAVKISDNVALDEDEPSFLLVSAHHCRELVTPEVALNLISHLVTGYGSDATATGLVDGQEIWVAPVWNPDGYEYVFTTDNLWRKNRRVLPGGVGVDLNRNYPFGWSQPCSGSTVTSSLTYKGPSAASEVETQTMMAFSADRRFARVIDFHSFGEEVVYGYLCSSAHPFTGWWQQQADAIASAAGFVDRTPVAEGEHFQWQLARGALSFLVECHTQFQPTHASALAEAAQVLPGILQLLTLPAALTGHVTDACTDAPLDANVTLAGVRFPNGETVSSGGDAGRYDLLMPPLTVQVNFDRPGFRHGNVALAAMPGVEQAADVELLANAVVAGPGTVAVGNPAPFVFTSLSDAGNVYGGLMSVSGISPGIPINDCTLPVKPDPTTFLPFKAPVPFANFVGVLDAAGSTTATFHVPNDPVLAGIDFDFAFFTVDSATLAPRHASNAAHLTTTP